MNPRQPTISLCMIVRDEEALIGHCLESVRNLVDEIVLVDTGSTDRTIEIAKSFGAKVKTRPWDEDFSAPRNLTLTLAACDWIMVLDADEVIRKEDHRLIRELIQSPDRAYLFTQRHYTGNFQLSGFLPCSGENPDLERGHRGYCESALVRLFPNHLGIRFQGRIHELVEHSINSETELKIVRSEVRIHHYGHTASRTEQRNKRALYAPLGKLKLESEVEEWKNYYELGVEYNIGGRSTESAEALRASAQLNPSYAPTWINLAYVLTDLSDYEGAISALNQAIKLNPDDQEAHCNLGVVFLRRQQFRKAIRCFKKATALNPRYVNAYCNLGLCYKLLAQYARAVETFRAVIEFFPDCAEARAELGAIHCIKGEVAQAEKLLEQAQQADPTLPKTYLFLGSLYATIRRNREAIDCLKRYCELERSRYQDRLPDELLSVFDEIEKRCEQLSKEGDGA